VRARTAASRFTPARSAAPSRSARSSARARRSCSPRRLGGVVIGHEVGRAAGHPGDLRRTPGRGRSPCAAASCLRTNDRVPRHRRRADGQAARRAKTIQVAKAAGAHVVRRRIDCRSQCRYRPIRGPLRCPSGYVTADLRAGCMSALRAGSGHSQTGVEACGGLGFRPSVGITPMPTFQDHACV